MNENTTDGLKLGAGLIMTIVLIGAIITVLMIGINFIQKGGGQASDLAQNFSNQQFTQYDNQVVTGDTIMSLISQYQNTEIAIWVEDVNFCWQSDAPSSGHCSLGDEAVSVDDMKERIRAANNRTDGDHYIAPTRKYYCQVCTDETTEAITALFFEPVDASGTP